MTQFRDLSRQFWVLSRKRPREFFREWGSWSGSAHFSTAITDAWRFETKRDAETAKLRAPSTLAKFSPELVRTASLREGPISSTVRKIERLERVLRECRAHDAAAVKRLNECERALWPFAEMAAEIEAGAYELDEARVDRRALDGVLKYLRKHAATRG